MTVKSVKSHQFIYNTKGKLSHGKGILRDKAELQREKKRPKISVDYLFCAPNSNLYRTGAGYLYKSATYCRLFALVDGSYIVFYAGNKCGKKDFSNLCHSIEWTFSGDNADPILPDGGDYGKQL